MLHPHGPPCTVIDLLRGADHHKPISTNIGLRQRDLLKSCRGDRIAWPPVNIGGGFIGSFIADVQEAAGIMHTVGRLRQVGIFDWLPRLWGQVNVPLNRNRRIVVENRHRMGIG